MSDHFFCTHASARGGSPCHPIGLALGGLLAMALFSTLLRAQSAAGATLGEPSMMIAIGGGYELSRGEYDLSRSLHYEASGTAGNIILALDVILPRYFDESFGVKGRIERTFLGSEGVLTEMPPGTFVPRRFREPAIERKWSRETFHTETIQGALMGTCRLPLGLMLDVGPYVGYRNLGTFDRVTITSTTVISSQREFIDTIVWPDDVWTTAYQQAAGDVTFGALLGISRPIRFRPSFGRSLTIIPELHLRADLSSRFNAGSLAMFSVGAMLSAGITLFTGDSAAAPLIGLYALDEDGGRMDHAAVRSGIVEHDRHLSIAPRITFDDSLSSRYDLLSSDAVAAFDLDSVLRQSPALIERNLPNILGATLRGGSSRLHFVATVDSGERSADALARAEPLRRYLVERWGIPADWIEVTTGPGAGRAVRVDSVLELETRWSAPALRLSTIRVESSVDEKDLPQGWVIRLLRDSRELARQSADTAAGRLSLAPLKEDLQHGVSTSPLVAELGVMEATELVSQARSELPFLFEGGTRPDRVIEYLLLAGSVDDAMLERIAAAVRSGDRVTVTGLDTGAREQAISVTERLEKLVGTDVTIGAPAAAASSVSPFPGGVRVVIERRE